MEQETVTLVPSSLSSTFGYSTVQTSEKEQDTKGLPKVDGAEEELYPQKSKASAEIFL
jgi:hypothetical protein